VDNPHASQFEFRPFGPNFVRMFDLKDDREPKWTGQYARSGRPMLAGPPGKPGDPDPHMQIIADKLNEAVQPLNEMLRHV